jgi:hypothetical protein
MISCTVLRLTLATLAERNSLGPSMGTTILEAIVDHRPGLDGTRAEALAISAAHCCRQSEGGFLPCHS